MTGAVKNSEQTAGYNLRRDTEYKTTITPVKSGDDDEYRIGIWVGTARQCRHLTFINHTNNVYGALGHGINDIDTGSLLEVGSGTLMRSNIKGIKKGVKGARNLKAIS